MNYANSLKLARGRLGREEAEVEAFFRTHQEAVYRLALSLLEDPAEAEEAAQDSLVAALAALDTYRGESALATWLYAITLNVCRGRLRKRRSRDHLLNVLRAVLRLGGEAARQPEEAAIRSEADEQVMRAIDDLDEKHRLPVILRYFGDCSTAEIARVLGISEGTVHSRLYTARERLRARLAPTLMPSRST